MIKTIYPARQRGGVSKLMLLVLAGMLASGAYYAKKKGYINKKTITSLTSKITGKGPAKSGKYTGYGIQVMATKELGQATSVMDDFAKDGYSAFVIASKNKGRTVYKVRLGPYGHRPEADAIKDKVKRRYPNSPYLKSSFVIYRPD